MEFFNSAVDVLQTLVIALGAGLGIWGVINLLEGYGNDNPGAKKPRDMKHCMAGGGVALDRYAACSAGFTGHFRYTVHPKTPALRPAREGQKGG
mgnify:CR=1 FL=1